MFNFLKNKIKLSATGIISIILSVLLVISIVLCYGCYSGWFDSDSISVSSSELCSSDSVSSGSGLLISDTSSNNIKLTSEVYQADDSVTSYESYAYITATFTDDYGVIYDDVWIVWSFTWVDGTNDDISDYVDCSVITFSGETNTIYCNKAFSKQIIMKVMAEYDDETFIVNCTLDYDRPILGAFMTVSESWGQIFDEYTFKSDYLLGSDYNCFSFLETALTKAAWFSMTIHQMSFDFSYVYGTGTVCTSVVPYVYLPTSDSYVLVYSESEGGAYADNITVYEFFTGATGYDCSTYYSTSLSHSGVDNMIEGVDNNSTELLLRLDHGSKSDYITFNILWDCTDALAYDP